MKITDKIRTESTKLAKKFLKYIYEDTDPDFYLIAWDPYGIIEYNDYYWNMSEVFLVMDRWISPKVALAWYEYNSEASVRWDYPVDIDHKMINEYILNLHSFSLIYDESETVNDFLLRYKEEVDDNKKYWNSEEWKEKIEKQNKKLLDKYLKDIWK